MGLIYLLTPTTNMKEDSKLWLHRLFNSNCFDIWLLVSYLYRYQIPGIQYYLINILRTKSKAEIAIVLPQLVHIYKITVDNFILQEFLTEQGLEVYFLLENDPNGINNEIILKNRKKRKMWSGKLFGKHSILKNRMDYRSFPCPIIPHQANNSLAIQGLILLMTSAITSFFDIGLAHRLITYKDTLRVHLKEKSQKSLQRMNGSFLKSNFNKILPSIRFFRELVNISKRIKCLPRSVRQRGLEIEIELLNVSLPAELNFIFDDKRFFTRAISEFSYVLDSAENTPYFIIFETIKFPVNKKTVHNSISPSPLKVVLESSDSLTEPNASEGISQPYNNETESLSLDKNISGLQLIESESIYDKNLIQRSILDLSELKKASIILQKLYDLENKKDYSVDEINETRERIVINLKSLRSNVQSENMTWDEKITKIRENSIYKNEKGYEIICAIIKRGSEICQEVVALQLLTEMNNIFKEEKLNIYLKTYKIFIIDKRSACIEAITNAESVHCIKKKDKTILNFFKRKFKDADFNKAVNNFLHSLIGYSLATYFLQVKDRHNGNILIDSYGSIIHVDFGFILGNYPGFYCVERAPFKFSTEYIEILGDKLPEFKSLFHEGFLALRKNSDRLCRILEVFCEKSPQKMFNKGVLESFKERFQLSLSDGDIEKWVSGLITWSINSMGTGLYDSFQYFSHGYLK